MPTARQEARILDNEIYDNSAALAGGGVRFCYFYGTLPRPVVERNTILNNDAVEGAGMMCYEADSLSLYECVFAGNDATSKGGALLTGGIALTPRIDIVRCTLHGNSAPDTADPPSGGGVYVRQGNVNIGSCIVTGNAGGGLVCEAQPGNAMGSNYSDVWNNDPHDYWGCVMGIHNISSDPLFCGMPPTSGDARRGRDVAPPPPWFCIYEHSPCNGTGRYGYDMGAGWVGCFSVASVVFYDNFSDQSDDGWVREEEWPSQIQVQAGEYSMYSMAGEARSHVAGLQYWDVDLVVNMTPLDTQLGGETRAYFRMSAEDRHWYVVGIETEAQHGTLKRIEGDAEETLAEFSCPVLIDETYRLAIAAFGLDLSASWRGPHGETILFSVHDPHPLPAGTVGLGVAWLQAPEDRGAQHTHFDNVMVCNGGYADVAEEDAGSHSDQTSNRWRLDVRPFPNPSVGAIVFPVRASVGLTGGHDATGGLSRFEHLQLELFDMQGRLVRSIARKASSGASDALGRSTVQSAGNALHTWRVSTEVIWDGRGTSGRQLAGGVYFWRMSAGQVEAHGQLLLVR
ncbi:right-handed parallel beta-helix repeat-containing protein [Candidatus Eisenbacteria bacterium]|uniref:Right-handed parallel beta-helix repeat-containing protein n=1 Tax=Eiseniibacteriota bacterium TaxID=2212470 RepID=A0ABV6YHZ5_UNCEI